MTDKPPFIKYWFTWNGWGNIGGKESTCCDNCIYFDDTNICTEEICAYCMLHNVQVKRNLVCNDHKEIKK